MRLGQIRHTITRLCWRLLAGTVETVPEWNQVCEFDCRATSCDWERWESCERRLGASGVVQAQTGFCRIPAQNGAVEAVSQRLSPSAIAREVVAPNSQAKITNILVLGTQKSVPLKRTELRFAGPQEVFAALNALGAALQRNGVEFRTVRNPGMPHSEIWLTSPLHDGGKTLLFCAVTATEQTGEFAAAQAGSTGTPATVMAPAPNVQQPQQAASEGWQLHQRNFATRRVHSRGESNS
jgi:hypothetical protein